MSKQMNKYSGVVSSLLRGKCGKYIEIVKKSGSDLSKPERVLYCGEVEDLKEKDSIFVAGKREELDGTEYLLGYLVGFSEMSSVNGRIVIPREEKPSRIFVDEGDLERLLQVWKKREIS